MICLVIDSRNIPPANTRTNGNSNTFLGTAACRDRQNPYHIYWQCEYKGTLQHLQQSKTLQCSTLVLIWFILVSAKTLRIFDIWYILWWLLSQQSSQKINYFVQCHNHFFSSALHMMKSIRVVLTLALLFALGSAEPETQAESLTKAAKGIIKIARLSKSWFIN